jgi:predicted restriction endonuclease
MKKEIRENFRSSVFKRDGFKCKFCNINTDLDAHHIVDRHEMPNGGYVLENGISLCYKHHFDAEQFHISDGKSWVEGMHPNDLYRLIGSSYEDAFEKSEKIKG